MSIHSRELLRNKEISSKPQGAMKFSSEQKGIAINAAMNSESSKSYSSKSIQSLRVSDRNSKQSNRFIDRSNGEIPNDIYDTGHMNQNRELANNLE